MTDAVSSTTAASGTSVTSTAAVRKPTQTFDSETFMKLLVVQLKSQDPSSPMDTNAMIGQTTQLATMEKLTTMADLSADSYSLQTRMAAANVVGKQVTYAGADGIAVTGIATSVTFNGDKPTVTVGGKTMDLSALSGVAAA